MKITEQKYTIKKGLGIIPNEGVIIVEPFEEKLSAAIVISDSIKQRDQAGRVVAVGAPVSDARIKDLFHTSPAEVGDVVVHEVYYAEPFTHFKTGIRYRFIKFQNILAVIKE